MRLHKVNHHAKSIFAYDRNGIQDKKVIAFRIAHGDVVRSSEPYILRKIVKLHIREIAADHFLRAVDGSVINDHDLACQITECKRTANAFQSAAQEFANIVVDYDDGNIHVRCSLEFSLNGKKLELPYHQHRLADDGFVHLAHARSAIDKDDRYL